MVSKETLIKRMEKEIAEAKMNLGNEGAFLRSIEKVKLLCELLLDEDDGNDLTVRTDEPHVPKTSVQTSSYDEDDLNQRATSILDF